MPKATLHAILCALVSLRGGWRVGEPGKPNLLLSSLCPGKTVVQFSAGKINFPFQNIQTEYVGHTASKGYRRLFPPHVKQPQREAKGYYFNVYLYFIVNITAFVSGGFFLLLLLWCDDTERAFFHEIGIFDKRVSIFDCVIDCGVRLSWIQM
jgi:hypothetical protein